MVRAHWNGAVIVEFDDNVRVSCRLSPTPARSARSAALDQLRDAVRAA